MPKADPRLKLGLDTAEAESASARKLAAAGKRYLENMLTSLAVHTRTMGEVGSEGELRPASICTRLKAEQT